MAWERSDQCAAGGSRGLLDVLRERGYRLTPQRQLIVELLEAASGHITPEDIYQQVSQRFPNVNRSTVYRTLDLLEELGFLTHAHLDHGAMRYHHADDAAHIHLVCHACGQVMQIDDLSIGADLVARLWERYRFAADLTHHSIAGRCARCQATQPVP